MDPVDKKSRNVVYLIASPLQARDYARFGIDIWMSRGWNVFVFDFTKILKEDFWNYVRGDHISVEFSGLKIFSTKEEAIGWFDRIKGDNIFIDLIGASPFEQECRKLAKRNGGKTLKFYLGPIPFQRRSFLKKIQMAFAGKANIVDYIYARLSFFNKMTHPDYIVVGGLKSERSIKTIRSKVIRAHSLDYDLTLNDEKCQDLDSPYILFLDEDACFHSDYIHMGIKPCASPVNYFPIMNRWLRQMATIFGSEVIIAAHPRSEYEKRFNSFEYPIIKNRTYDLIKNAKLIVAHGSTAIQLAVLCRKPILLVTTNELENSYCSATYSKFRSELQKSIINLDYSTHAVDLLKESAVDDSIYDCYIENYIKQSGSPDITSWSIIIDSLELDLEMD